ncbi:MAG TPA: urease accessory UreF family protein [Acidimicrobiales bacterium]|nr:urease accessory UreF family protein [Acidimicrobiales bacterium]
MSESLKLLLADARFPSGSPAHSGGMEAACAVGLVTDVDTLRSFLYGRLWTAGVIGAVAAAAVCARCPNSASPTALFRAVEAELDARIPSPAARQASREQGHHILRLAVTISSDPLLDALARATVGNRQRPHYPTSVGVVAAVAGCTPADAAEAAAYASVAGPAFAAQTLLSVRPEVISELGVEMAPEVSRLAHEASQTSMRSLAQMPAFGAPALEYLAEEHVAQIPRSFAS